MADDPPPSKFNASLQPRLYNSRASSLRYIPGISSDLPSTTKNSNLPSLSKQIADLGCAFYQIPTFIISCYQVILSTLFFISTGPPPIPHFGLNGLPSGGNSDVGIGKGSHSKQF